MNGRSPIRNSSPLPRSSSDVEGWFDYCETIATGLRKLAVTDRAGAVVSTADAVSQWVAMTRTAHDSGGAAFIIRHRRRPRPGPPQAPPAGEKRPPPAPAVFRRPP